MTKKFTSKHKLLGLALMFISLFGSSAFNASQAQTYCIPYSWYGCNMQYDYGTCERVQLKDVSGNIIYDKPADGCNTTSTSANASGNGFTLISTKPSFTLSSGSTYTLGISVSMTYNTTSIYNGYSINEAVWIDLNADGTFSSSEYIASGWSNPVSGNAKGIGGALNANKFKIPCGIKAGTTRMRIITSYSYTMGASGSCPQGGSASPYHYYGEQEDYTIALANPTSLAAGFFMPSTAYVGTPVTMTNANQTGYIAHQWDVNDDGSIEYVTTNAKHIFATAGTKCVRLKSQNCLGRDSVLKCINIVNPTNKPVVDFAANTNEVERFGTVNFIDLSTNGPTYWSWYMYVPGVDSAKTRADIETYNSNLVGSNAFVNANPAVFFNLTGSYTVCLQTSNNLGPSSVLCKKNYVRVTPFKDNNLGAGTVQPIFEQNGNIIDDGGRTGNYSSNRIDYATIIPCGAKKITLKFSQFKVLTGDILRIYDGTDASYPPLHTGSGFTAGNVPTGPIVATSGAMYIYFTTNGSGVDSGFIASWTTERGPAVLPIANFTVPDTLYNPISYTYVNTSQNVLGKTDFVWDIEPGYGEVGYTKDLDYAIMTDNNYDVTMTATTCSGSDSKTKTIVVVTPHTPAKLDFSGSNRRPNTGEVVTFKAFNPDINKAIKADKFQWTFFPGTASPANGATFNDMITQVRFNAKGKYTVSLRGWNSLDSANTSAQIIKADYVIVVEHCTPLLGVSASSDVAINNVTLTDNNGKKLIDNTSANNILGYDDYTLNGISANVTYGAKYNVALSRITNVNPMSRRVWIDWNIDGDFDDAGETVASENTATTLSFNQDFVVPDNTKAFAGKTRMRVGTSYSTDPNLPCGASSGVNLANRIGEFEDYTLFIMNDNTPPMLTLIGADTLYLEVGSTFTDPGATANDATEGNITSKIVVTSDVDMSFTGIYYLQYNVMDAGGNPAVPVNRVVYVVKDQTAPVITLNGTDVVYVEVFSPYTEDGATAQDNKDGNISNAIVISGTVNTNVTGTYVLTYSVNDISGNHGTKTRTVIVRDTQKPIIANSDADLSNNVKVQIVSVFIDRTKVTDNYDAPALVVTAGSSGVVDTRFPGTYPMIYNAMDAAGNKADTKTYNYIVDDYVGPTITLNTLDTIIWTVNKAYTPIQASASDNYYNNTQVSITRTSTVNAFKIGLYYDEFIATDGSGNVTTRRRWVRVIDDVAPVINGSAMNVGLFSHIDATQGLTITDNYDAPSVLRTKLVVLSNNLNTYEEGVYSVTFQVTDQSGNVSFPYERTIWVSRIFPTINGSSSVNDINKDKTINVYPNPSTGIVNISYNFATPENMDVNVYNATGALVTSINSIHGQSGVQSIDLSTQANGLYHVQMIVSGKQISRTISLNK